MKTTAYPSPVEQQMRRFYCSLNEPGRRRYAAVEALKLGHGGIKYAADLFGCDSKTVAKGIEELSADEALDTARQRKKGADAK